MEMTKRDEEREESKMDEMLKGRMRVMRVLQVEELGQTCSI